ncbi:unnamed protein product [Amoebophrya sp. A120]|nr:unnamed protein product [Amoebophrya sp. A120]|eukprot:GSA120T00001647001.1
MSPSAFCFFSSPRRLRAAWFSSMLLLTRSSTNFAIADQALLGTTSKGLPPAPTTYPNPPAWPKGAVTVFRPDEEQSPADKQAILDDIFSEHGTYTVHDARGYFEERGREFSQRRHAFLFLPGKHSVTVNVGYYHHVLGLGEDGEVDESHHLVQVAADEIKRSSDATSTSRTTHKNHKSRSRKRTQIEKVQVLNGSPDFRAGALTNFWRKAENFHTPNDLNWWVSQASTLRRVSVAGSLFLSGMDWPSFNFGYSSGGFVADVVVGKDVDSGSQQQFCFRNVQAAGRFVPGSWNFVLLDCVFEQGGDDASLPKITKVDGLPIFAKKPFLVAHNTVAEQNVGTKRNNESDEHVPAGAHQDNQGLQHQKYFIVVPAAETTTSRTATIIPKDEAAPAPRALNKKPRRISFERVFVADPSDADVIAKINHVLSSATEFPPAVVLTPGIYHCRGNESVTISRPETLLLGIGLATLVAHGETQPCLVVTDKARGSRISGLIVQPAPDFRGDTLVQIGKKNDRDQNRAEDERASTCTSSCSSRKNVVHGVTPEPEDHIFLYDIFVRVGGDTDSRVVEVRAKSMMTILASHVVLENLWLWRADHDIGGDVRKERNPVDHALEVHGNSVTIYGLAAEHVLRDQVRWYGQHGRVYFFQSEFPYDAHGVGATEVELDSRVVAYRVMPNVTSHDARGLSVYSFFRDHDVEAQTAISFPDEALLTPKATHDVTTELSSTSHAANCTGSGELQPAKDKISLRNLCSRYLNGYGGIRSIANGFGPSVDRNNPGPVYFPSIDAVVAPKSMLKSKTSSVEEPGVQSQGWSQRTDGDL